MSRVPRAGETLQGRWKLDKQIARGGVGYVFEATDLTKGEKVAVKVMTPRAAENPFLRRKFFDEGKIAASLGQLGNIETGKTLDALPFFAMSLLKGENLETKRLKSPTDCLSVEHGERLRDRRHHLLDGQTVGRGI